MVSKFGDKEEIALYADGSSIRQLRPLPKYDITSQYQGAVMSSHEVVHMERKPSPAVSLLLHHSPSPTTL